MGCRLPSVYAFSFASGIDPEDFCFGQLLVLVSALALAVTIRVLLLT